MRTYTNVRSPNEMIDWWTQAKPDDAAIYHHGIAPIDRAPPLSQLTHDQRQQLKENMGFAWTMYGDGKVLLAQKKAGEVYDYVMIKRGK